MLILQTSVIVVYIYIEYLHTKILNIKGDYFNHRPAYPISTVLIINAYYFKTISKKLIFF